MEYKQLLTLMFADSVRISEQDNIITGMANYADTEFAICGIVNEAPLDSHMNQYLAEFILTKIMSAPTTKFLILVDTAGQQTTRFAELSGLNRYIAHLAKTIHFARHNGARVFSLVHGKALGGAFIASGLNAEKIYALESSQIAVMWLEAMSKVTKIPLIQLQQLSQTSPIFAPGASNFVKLGVVEAILTTEQIMPQIIKDLAHEEPNIGSWRKLGFERGGRTLADKVVKDILNA